MHSNSRYTYHVVRGNYNLPIVFTHSNCMCNELVAFRARHAVWDPACTSDGITFKRSRNALRKIICNNIQSNIIAIEEFMTYDEVIAKYAGRFRRKYERAKYLLLNEGINYKDFNIKCFIKDDKYHLPFDGNFGMNLVDDFYCDFKVKAPRAIQYQSPKATLFKAQFIIPLEKQFYNMVDVHGLKIFTKGLNQFDIAQLLVKGSMSVNNPVYIENDYSSFDAHVVVHWLQLFRKFIMDNVPSNYRDIVGWAMRFDDIVRGWTSRGICYTVMGTLTSGSIDTSFKGNFINFVIVTDIMTRLSIPKESYKFICNGDDSVLILDASYLDKYLAVDFKDYAMDAKVIVKKSIFDVEFCQCTLIRTPNGMIMARNPMRLLTRLGWMTTKRSYKYHLSYLKTVIMGEMAVNYMVPIVYPMLRKMLHMLRGVKLVKTTGNSYLDEMYFNNSCWKLDNPYPKDHTYDYQFLNRYPLLADIDPIKFMRRNNYHNDDMNADLLYAVLERIQLGVRKTATL